MQTDQIDFQISSTQTIVDTMAQTKPEFLKLVPTIINYKFEGDPLKLTSFLADVELIEDVVEQQNLPTCLKFVKRCVVGKAQECIPEDADTIQKFKDALKASINPPTTDVVEGDLLALKVKRGDFSEFTKEAERLSEAYRRSLVASGISLNRAQEMTIKKTIELCRKTA